LFTEQCSVFCWSANANMSNSAAVAADVAEPAFSEVKDDVDLELVVAEAQVERGGAYGHSELGWERNRDPAGSSRGSYNLRIASARPPLSFAPLFAFVSYLLVVLQVRCSYAPCRISREYILLW